MLKTWQKNPYRLTVVLAIAVILKCILLILANSKAINPDGVLYISAARHFAAGNFKQALSLFQMPLYPALVAMVHLFFADWSVAARIVSASSLVLVNIPLFWITRELFSKKAAFWACLAFTVAPELNEGSIKVIRDPLFLLLLSWAMLFALRSMRSEKPGYFVAVLLFCGASLLCRLEGIVFIGFYAVCLIFWVIRYPQKRGYYLKGVSIWGGAFGLVCVGIYFWHTIADIALVNRFGFLIDLFRSVLTLEFLYRYSTIYAFLETLEGTGPFAGFGKGFLETSRHYLFLIYAISLLEAIVKIVWPFFCIPLFWARKCQKDRFFWFGCGISAAYFMSTYIFLIRYDYTASRYVWIAAFSLYPLIGLGFTKIFEKLEATRYSRIWFAVLCVVFFVSPTAISVTKLTDDNTGIVTAGRWLAAQNLPETVSIATMETRIVYYAGLDLYENVDESKGVGERFTVLQNVDSIEMFEEQKTDIIVLKHSRKQAAKTVESERYQKVKSFEDDKYRITVYYSRRFLQRVE